MNLAARLAFPKKECWRKTVAFYWNKAEYEALDGAVEKLTEFTGRRLWEEGLMPEINTIQRIMEDQDYGTIKGLGIEVQVRSDLMTERQRYFLITQELLRNETKTKLLECELQAIKGKWWYMLISALIEIGSAIIRPFLTKTDEGSKL